MSIPSSIAPQIGPTTASTAPHPIGSQNIQSPPFHLIEVSGTPSSKPLFSRIMCSHRSHGDMEKADHHAVRSGLAGECMRRDVIRRGHGSGGGNSGYVLGGLSASMLAVRAVKVSCFPVHLLDPALFHVIDTQRSSPPCSEPSDVSHMFRHSPSLDESQDSDNPKTFFSHIALLLSSNDMGLVVAVRSLQYAPSFSASQSHHQSKQR